MLPSTFRALRALERINVAGVGLALAAATAASLSLLLTHERDAALFTGVPTLLLGLAWARLLRWPRTLSGGTFRVGWLLSVPLASANAGLAAALMFGVRHDHFRLSEFLAGFLAGATVGVLIWGPALLLTLLCFGLPISWAQHAARKGLAGQERGEFVVGAASLVVALGALLLATAVPAYASSLTSLWFARAAGVAGALCGVAAIAVSASRARRRRAFVAEVEAGRVERFRIDLSAEGKVLVRLGARGHDYRVADLEEELVLLDGGGSAARRA